MPYFGNIQNNTSNYCNIKRLFLQFLLLEYFGCATCSGLILPQMAFGGGAGGGAGGTFMTGGQQQLQTVKRTRSVFPETWLWSNKTVGYIVLF